MAKIKFKKKPAHIYLDSVRMETTPMGCCGGGEAYCEGKVCVIYGDQSREFFYLNVMSNLCQELPDEDEDEGGCDCGDDSCAHGDLLDFLPDDEFMYAVSRVSFGTLMSSLNPDAASSKEDKAAAKDNPVNYESMKEAFASPFGDILRKLTVMFALYAGYDEDSDDNEDGESD